MILRFNELTLHNFLSYEDTTVEFSSKGFCLVSGQNNYRKDSALSNGSGKSTLWSAICFALTGETINGVKTNLKNLYTVSDECYVKLHFTVDKDDYVVIRYIEPKSDLKIIKNGDNISGKGIRESEKILAENLPDLTKELISSTILLGQGLPNRFSSFSPSGRKELLERLTKSNFMIEDIKVRLSNRLTELSQQQREYEDNLLISNTQLSTDNMNLTTYQTALAAFNKKDFAVLINQSNEKITAYQNSINELTASIKTAEDENEILNKQILEMIKEKAAANDTELTAYSAAYNQASTEKATTVANAKYLTEEIKRLKTIKDVCPTCGQHIPGVLKPDTTEQEKNLASLNETIRQYDVKLVEISEKHKTYLNSIDTTYSLLPELQEKLRVNKVNLQLTRDSLTSSNTALLKEKEELSKLIYDRDNEEKNYTSLKNAIADLQLKIKTTTDSMKIVELAKTNIEERTAVVKKIDTLVKRDFRGYLLYNIIEYLNQKAKEYSQIVFGTDELSIYLDGNALDISYCGKIYEMLSGGEKQRVDLITQFAIRDLLQAYFNYSSNILVLDEITDNLDKVATDKIFNLITDKLKDVESVFIISHHADELEIPVDSEIHIIKDTNGISSIKENS